MKDCAAILTFCMIIFCHGWGNALGSHGGPCDSLEVQGAIGSPVCEGVDLTFTASGASYYLWEGPNGFTSMQPMTVIPQAGPQHAGTYRLVGFDVFGCSDTIVLDAVVHSRPRFPFGGIEACAEGPFSLQATGGTPPLEYAIQEEPFQEGGAFAGLSPGDYTVRVRDVNGCADSALLTVFPLPDIVQLIVVEGGCSQPDGSLTVIATGNAPFQYDLNGSPPGAVQQFDGLSPGTYTVRVTDAFGCSRSATVELNTATGPVITEVFADAAQCGLPDGRIRVSVQGNAPLAFSLDNNPPQASSTFGALAPGTYTITVQDPSGCTASTDVVVERTGCEVFFPNAFTPNGDGVNDKFRIFPPVGITAWILQYRIYDRWGTLLHEASDFPSTESGPWWDGFHKDKKLEPGVFLYTVDYRIDNGQVQSKAGEFSLMR